MPQKDIVAMQANYTTSIENNNKNVEYSTLLPSNSDILSALSAIPADMPHFDRVKVASALKTAGFDADTYVKWRSNTSKADPSEDLAVFKSAKSGVVPTTYLFKIARQHGWKPDTAFNAPKAPRRAPAPIKVSQPIAVKPSDLAAAIYDAARPVTSHPYLNRKGIPAPAGLRVIPFRTCCALCACKGFKTKTGYLNRVDLLVTPITHVTSGALIGVELIDDAGGKSVKGEKSGGYFPVQLPESRDYDGIIYCAEGMATTTSIHSASTAPAVATLSVATAPQVIMLMRQQYPLAQIVWCADIDKNGQPTMPRDYTGLFAVPNGSEKVDFNDQHAESGIESVAKSLAAVQRKTDAKPAKPAAIKGYGKALKSVASLDDAKAFIKRFQHQNPITKSCQQFADEVANHIGGHHAELRDYAKDNAPDLEQAKELIRRYQHQCPHKKTWEQLADEVADHVGGHHAELRDYAALIRQRVIDKINAQRQLTADYVVGDIQQALALVKRLYCENKRHFAVRAPMGSGKTYHLLKPLAEEIKKALIVSHRVSLTNSSAGVIKNCVHYQDRNIENADMVALCINSLLGERYANTVNNSEIAAIDEFAHVLAELFKRGGTMGTSAKQIAERMFSVLNDLFSIVTDADLTDNEIAISNSYGYKPIIIDVTAQEMPISACIYTAQEPVIKALEMSIGSGQKTLIACSSAKMVLKLERKLHRLFPHKKGLVIQATDEDGNIGDANAKAFIKNPDNCHYDYVIYSPAVESGVSINSGYFTAHYAFYNCNIEPENMLQMIRRDRKATHWHIAVTGSNNSETITAQQSADRFIYGAFLQGAASGHTAAPFGQFDINVAAMEGKRSALMCHAAQRFCLIMESLGDVAFIRDMPDSQEFKEEMQRVTMDADIDLTQRINAAPAINAEYRDILAKKTAKTRQQSNQKAAFDINELFGADRVSVEQLQLFNNGKLKSQLRNYQFATVGLTENEVTADTADHENNVATTLRKNYAARSKCWQVFAKSCGLDLSAGTGTVTADGALDCYDALHNSPLNLALRQHGILRGARPTRAGAVRWLGTVLAKLGLHLSRRGANASGEYSLEQGVKVTGAGCAKVPGLALMQELLSNNLGQFRLNNNNNNCPKSDVVTIASKLSSQTVPDDHTALVDWLIANDWQTDDIDAVLRDDWLTAHMTAQMPPKSPPDAPAVTTVSDYWQQLTSAPRDRKIRPKLPLWASDWLRDMSTEPLTDVSRASCDMLRNGYDV